jgi:plasmid stabilization system protein ParE
VTLRLRLLAALDIDGAARWYEAQREGLGDAFDEAIRAQLTRIERWPRAYRTVYRDVRRVLVRRFPFAIYFVLVDATDTEVLAVVHQHRDPEAWLGRV